jgi:hypothetical protein
MKSIAGTAWGFHCDNMLILYKGLVRSVLEYGCVCFSEMAVTHFNKLEWVQWRALRISLGWMQSTHTGTVEVLSGVPPLDLRFSYLNRRFLINAFSKGSDTLRGRLQTLADLGSGKIMREFTSVQALGIEPRDSYVQHNFRALLSVPEVIEDMQSALASTSVRKLCGGCKRISLWFG